MARKRKSNVSQPKRSNGSEEEEEERKSKRRKDSPLQKNSSSGQKPEQPVYYPPASIIINDPYRIEIPAPCTPTSFKILPTPTKSEADTKLYRLIQLSNGVIALLISDLEDENLKGHNTDTNTEEPIICTNNNPMETIECNLFDEITKPNDDIDGINLNFPRNHGPTFQSKNNDRKLGKNKYPKNSKFKYHQTKKNQDSKIHVAAVVKVGSYSNPKKLPGLAHFVEHMVHLGSHQFPNVKDFKSLIRTHGCSSNAKTSGDFTTFQYNIYPTEFERSFEMFSRFFIDPIFDVQWIKKEIWNLDNEFTLARSADGTHRWELLRTLIKDGHPMKNFTCGNFESLTKISDLRRNLDSDDPDYPFATLQKELQKFHSKFYTADNLSIVIQAPLQLGEMETVVVKYFSKVQKSTVQMNKKVVSSDQFNPYDMSKFHQYYRIEATSGCDKMYITWCLQSPTHFSYLVKAQDFLCELVKSSHLGGIKHTLYKKRWISNFAAVISQPCKYSSLFVITLSLTEKGRKDQESILEMIFSYMDKLQNQNVVDGTLGVDYETFYQKLQRNYQEKFKWSGFLPAQHVNNLALNIFKYNAQDVLSGPYLFSNYDAIEINHCLRQLSPQKANIMLFTNKTHVFHLRIPYSNTPYLQENIPPTMLSTSNHEFKNGIVTLPKSKVTLPRSKVKLTVSNNKYQKTFRREKTFFSSSKLSVNYRPLKGNTNYPPSITNLVKFHFREGRQDITQYAIKVVWITLIKLSAAEFGLPTSVKLSTTNSTISFRLCGFYTKEKTNSCYSKMKRLLLLTSKILRGNDCEFKELEKEYFEASKVYCMEHLHKLLYDSIRAAENLMDSLMDSSKFSAIELLNSVQNLDFNFFHASIRKLHTYMKIFVDIKCNHTSCSCPHKADNLGQFLRRRKLFIYNGLGSVQKSSFRQKATLRIMKAYPRGESIVRIRNMNQYCSNSVLMNCYQIGLNSKKAQTICNFIMTTMNYPAFFTIRSCKTIGYSVTTQMKVKNGLLLILIRVVFNSERFSMTEVEKEVNDFLQIFFDLNFRYIDDETFNKMKHFYWRCEGMEKVTLRQVQDWFFNHLLPSGHDYRKLSIQIVGNGKNHEKNPMQFLAADCITKSVKHEFEFINYDEKQNSRGDVKLDRIFISDLLNFKKTCKLYPKSNV